MQLINILGVIRTNAAASAVEPLFAELRSRGHHTTLFAEGGGQAKHRLKDHFVELTQLQQLLAAFDKKFDVVVTGLSKEREFEQIAEAEAKRRGIPLVQVEDYWGGHVITDAEPNLLLVVDAMAEKMSREAHPGMRTAVVGLPGLFAVTPDDALKHRLDEVRATTGARLIVYTDTGQEAMETLPLLVASIRQTTTPVMLIPKWNPNLRNDASDDGRTWAERCEEIIVPLREQGKILDVPESTDEVVMCADLTASGFSVLLFRALCAGKQALTLWTPFVEHLLKVKTGLTETPLMMLGGPTLAQPQPLDAILAQKALSVGVKPFDPKAAADAILSLV